MILGLFHSCFVTWPNATTNKIDMVIERRRMNITKQKEIGKMCVVKMDWTLKKIWKRN
uniref:Uncharacterized protein n=1 Tax=Rhizophora mucronata TaxID=61149 RepID=A0A2P2L1K8_RHIMU